MTTLPLLPDAVRGHATGVDEDAGIGALTTERGNLPLVALDVDSRVTGLLSATTVRQTFVNRHDVPLEATYVFPLPDRGAVHAFRMEVAGRVVDGVLKERAEARRAYDEALAQGRRAAIAEEDRPNVFTVRVGNIAPGEQAVVHLELSAPLPCADGEATYRFPLVVAPRYIPGRPLGGEQAGDGVAQDTDLVPDASRITPPVLLPGFPNPVRLGLRVTIDPAGLPFGEVASSLHAVAEQQHEGVRIVRLQPGERLDRDLILRIAVGDEAVRTAAVATADDDGGVVTITLVPPAGAHADQPPRDVVLVLDRSGSMSGWKMVAARRALARTVDALTDADRFSVLAFDTVVDHPTVLGDHLVEATDRNRFRAVEWLAGIDARGGTELAEPLSRALHLLGDAEPGRERLVVLVTDGQVGNEDAILAALAPRLGGTRVFTVGVDTAVNDAFLRRLAALGGGACELVESEDRLDTALARIQRRIGTPVLTDVSVSAEGLGLDVGTLTPARPGDLFAGVPIVVSGRFGGAAGGSVVVTGTDALGQQHREVVPVEVRDAPVLARAWARGRVRDLEDRYATGTADGAAIEREIVETSLRHGVLSRFTAFVAVDTAEVLDEHGQLHRVIQPVELPAGWAQPPSPPDAVMFSAMAAAPMPMASPSAMPPSAPAPVAPAQMHRAARAGAPRGKAMGAGRAAIEPVEADDLGAYRRAAAALLQRLEEGGALAAIVREVVELVTDLRSVGAPPEEVDALERAAVACREALVSGADPAAAREELVDALRHFSAGTSAGGGSEGRRGRPFWRR